VRGLGTCTWEAVGRTISQSLFGGQCTPSVISEKFAVVLL